MRQEVKSVRHNPDGPYDTQVEVGSYTFWRGDYIGRHLIDIKRPTVDGFYLTVGVKYDGDFCKQDNSVKITGFNLVGTNGSLADVQQAIEVTSHLW